MNRILQSLPSIFIGFIIIGVSVILTFSRVYRGNLAGAWH